MSLMNKTQPSLHGRCALPMIALLCTGTTLSAQTQQPAESFVIEANRPFVYLKFDHYGSGVPFNEGEPRLRLWFKFVNNCKIPILLRTFGVPDSLPQEIGVMDRVVPNEEVSGDFAVSFLPPLPMPPFPPGLFDSPQNSAIEAKPEKMPPGYWYDVGSLTSVAPGNAVLFSIPANQLGAGWHLEIPFRFDVIRRRGPYEPQVGGEPEMFLFYSLADLPDKVQGVLRK